MSVVPESLETDRGPPVVVPLGHFVAALGFLAVGVGLAAVRWLLPGFVPRPAVAHAVFVGWICVTIAGALVQFVPVWSGERLHSTRLAVWQLGALVVGIGGLLVGFSTGVRRLLVAGGVTTLVGFWLVVYNVGRTLWRARPLDVTERHFAAALGWLWLVTVAGVALAVAPWGIGGGSLRAAHVTVGVFGVVLTTVFGALYQLGSMFTSVETTRTDRLFRHVEEVVYPVGVGALAVARLARVPVVGRVGAGLVLVGTAAAFLVLGRRLLASQADGSATLRRYGVVAVSGLCWTAATAPVWLATPLAPGVILGPRAAVPLLVCGVLGGVIVGTLYHVVPFLIWIEAYADSVGFEPVPRVEELYDSRVERVDFWALVVGTALLVAEGWIGVGGRVAAVSVAVGVVALAWNLTTVVVRHGPTLWVPDRSPE